MARPKALPESHRQCRSCKLVLELNAKNFCPSRTCRNGFVLDCRGCWRIERREQWRIEHAGKARRRKQRNMGANCGECFGLPWQVVGPTCVGCGLAHAEEPRPEMVFWLSWVPAYV
jgi:hypothetical protein